MFHLQNMSFILIFKNKYFQTHGLENMWDLLSDGCNILTDDIVTVYWQKNITPWYMRWGVSPRNVSDHIWLKMGRSTVKLEILYCCNKKQIMNYLHHRHLIAFIASFKGWTICWIIGSRAQPRYWPVHFRAAVKALGGWKVQTQNMKLNVCHNYMKVKLVLVTEEGCHWQ